MTTDLPGTQLEPAEVMLHGVQVPYAGRKLYTQSMNITFLETVDWSTSKKFVRWMEIARSWRLNTGTSSSVYFTTAQLVLYNDTPEVVRTIQINNFWPSNVQEIQMDGSSSQPVQLSIEAKYTDWLDLT